MKKPTRLKFTLANRIKSIKGKTIRKCIRVEKDFNDLMTAMETAVKEFNTPGMQCYPHVEKDIVFNRPIEYEYTERLLKDRVVVLDAIGPENRAKVYGFATEEILTEDNICALTPVPAVLGTRRLCPIVLVTGISKEVKMDVLLNHEFIHAMLNIHHIYTLSDKLGYTRRNVDHLASKMNIAEYIAYTFEGHKVDEMFTKANRRKRKRMLETRIKNSSKTLLKYILRDEVI